MWASYTLGSLPWVGDKVRTKLEDTFGEYFLSLGEFEGEHYGIPTNINLKSMVWYPKDDFDAAGYEVPETWDDLMPSDEKNARGLEKIRQLPVDTPEEALKDVSIPPKSQTRSRS